VQYILRAGYEITDGSEESETTYALCYSCHDRASILDESPFEYHRLHVVDQRTACATCHSAHGSLENRGLIRFGEEVFVGVAAPSPATGRLAFISSTPGAGTCYLVCHGYDHAPESYGGELGLLMSPMR
jgi:predicted CXXCH cytochrome family protein